MSSKTIIVLYQDKESKIVLNLDEINSYLILKQKILSFYNESNSSFTFHLMAINSSSPYTLLEEDNFKQILNETIEGEDLKIFLNKIIPEEMNNNIENKNVEDDEDFIIEEGDDNNNLNINNEKNKSEEKKDDNLNINNNNEIDKQIKINEDNNINNEINNIENDNQDLFNQTDEMMKKIDKLMGYDDSLFLKHSKTVEPKSNENNINNSNNIKANGINIINKEDEIISSYPLSHKNQNININNINNEVQKDNIVDIDETSLIPNFSDINTFKSIKCTICQSQLSNLKYICIICENCILCEICENEHYHPCFKLKTNFLSSVKDIYKFITTFYSFKNNSGNFFTKLFTKEYEIKIYPYSDKKITLRQNKSFLLPIKIKNLSNHILNSSQFEIIPRNNKNIKIINPNIQFTIKENSSYILKLKCRSRKYLTKENVEFFLFSEDLIIKNKEGLSFNIEFEINEDWEEEQLNINLEYNEFGILYSKEHKKIALDVLNMRKNMKWDDSYVKNVFYVLVNCNWDKNAAINRIKNLK